MAKRGVLHFDDNNLRNGAKYVLDHYRTLIENRLWRIECDHMRAPTATEVTGIALGTCRILPSVSLACRAYLSICLASCFRLFGRRRFRANHR